MKRRTERPLRVSEASALRYLAENIGLCTACGHGQACVEPDAERYRCDHCGYQLVYGIEYLIESGRLEFKEGRQ